METKEWTFADKAPWGDGPWVQEPDKVQWPDPATGLPCMIRRSMGTGSWCGYVGVPEGHPAFEKDTGEIDVDVHGGVTLCTHCDPDEDSVGGICHVPAPGDPDNVWWVGFDCGHALDYSPLMMARLREIERPLRLHGEVYRDINYVKREVTELAAQLKAMSHA